MLTKFTLVLLTQLTIFKFPKNFSRAFQKKKNFFLLNVVVIPVFE